MATSKKRKNASVKKAMLPNIIWISIFFGSVFGGYKGVTRDDVLPIREISISGEFKQIAVEDMHALIVNGVSGNFFTFDVGDIYKKFYSMPWVEKIWVHRVWPDKINVEIREHQAVAILNNKGLLNDKGNVFISDTVDFKRRLPIFMVENMYEQEAIEAYRIYDEMLMKAGIRLTKFIFDGRKSQTLILLNGLKLKLGRVKTKERLKRFIAAYQSVLFEKKNKIQGVDLRYTNGFAVQWKQV